MTTAVYIVEVDWEADGTYGHASADITADVQLIDISRGRSKASPLLNKAAAGRLLVRVRNDDGKYSPSNSGSPVAGLLLPKRAIRVRTTAPSAVTLWTGSIERFQPDATQRNVTTDIKAVGTLAAVKAAKTTTAPLSAPTAKDIIDDILDDVGITAPLEEEIAALSPVGYWRLGEASGDALDTSGNGNDGTVTLGAGARDAAPLDDEGDGSIEFDGADTEVQIADNSAIQNIWDDGGALFFMFDADSDGQNSNGEIAGKGFKWDFNVVNEAAGLIRLENFVDFDVSFQHWFTPVNIPLNITIIGVWTYNADNVDNDPILYLWDGSILTTRTVGDGLTQQSTTPTGARVTDVGDDLIIGNSPTGNVNFDGHIDEVALFATILTAAEAKRLIAAALVKRRAIDTGQSTLARIWFEDRQALNALREIEDAEQGFLYEGRDAKVVYEDRHHRMKSPHLTSQATWTDAPGGALSYSQIVQRHQLKDIVNDVRITVPAYTVASIAPLWTLNETPSIAPGETKTWWAGWPEAATPAGRYVETWTTPDATDVTVTGVAFGDLGIVATKFAQSMKLEITNNGGESATIDLLRARGTAVTEDEPTIITSEDTTSQTAFGKRTFAPSARWLANTNDAQGIADFIISRYKDPVPLLLVTMHATRDAAAMSDALARDISDRVTVVANNDTQLGISGDFFIEAVRHIISKAGTLHVVEYLLSSVDAQTYWVLGTNTLGTGANPGRLAA